MSSPSAAIQPERWPTSSLLRRTVAVVDMVGYSSIARMLEENISAASVTELNRQIQDFMQRAIAASTNQCSHCVLAKTGDGIIILFDSADDAHSFATNVHRLAGEHNTIRSERTAQRWFRVGIATGDISATVCDSVPSEYAGTVIANAVRLETAAKTGQILVDSPTYDALSSEHRMLYGVEEIVKGKRTETFRAHRLQAIAVIENDLPVPSSLNRRTLLQLGAPVLGLGVCGLIVTRYGFDHWHSKAQEPLPPKKFVALLQWPSGTDSNSTIEGVVAAIESELTRAEATNPDLYIASHRAANDLKTFAQVQDALDTLGANLLLAVSITAQFKRSLLNLRLVDPQSQRVLREASIPMSANQQLTIADKSALAAAELLSLSKFQPAADRTMAGTSNAAAYVAFQTAETLVSQPNDSGLDAAIEKYKQALELDTRYGRAYAQLAWAYCRYYFIHSTASALALADWNSRSAIELAPQLAEAHIARASVLEYQGDKEGCQREIKTALSLDPVDARSINFQAQFYTRCDRWADAEVAFARVLKLRPNYWVAHNNLGLLYNDEGKYMPALNEFRVVTLLLPKSALAFNNVASVYLILGMMPEAMGATKTSLSLDPKGDAVLTMAELLRSEGRLQEAIGFARKATELNPDSSDGWLELGDCCAAAEGSSVQADQAYKRCLFLKAAELQSDAVDGPGWMILALLRAKLGDSSEASVCLQRASEYSANDIESQLCKARVLEVLGRRDEALQTVFECIKRGATPFQLKATPDLRALEKDPRFKDSEAFNQST